MPDSEDIRVSIVADTSGLDKGIKQSRIEIEKFRKSSQERAKIQLNINLVQFEKKIADARSELRKLRKAGDKEGEIKLRLKIKGLQANARVVRKELSAIGRAADKSKKSFFSLNGIVKDAVKAFGGLFILRQIGQFFSSSVKIFTEFEQGLARVNTVANVTTKELDSLKDGIKAISSSLPVSNKELIDAAFNISSAGVEFKNLIPLLELSAKVAVGANTDVATSFNGLIGVIKGYGLNLTDATGIAEKFFKTNELGQTTIGEVSTALQGLTVVAKNGGVSINELFAAFSTFTGVTGNANEVSTQFKSAIQALSAPTQEASNKLKQLGVEVGAAAIKEKGFATVAKEVFDAVGGEAEALRKLIPEKEALTLITALATGQFEKFKKSTEDLDTSQGSLERAVLKMANTTEGRLRILNNSYENFKEIAGGGIIFVAAELIKFGKIVVNTVTTTLSFIGILGLGIVKALTNSFGKALALAGAFSADLGNNFDKLGGVVEKAFKIISKNISIAFSSVGQSLRKPLNSALGVVERFVNSGLKALESLSFGVLSFNKIKIEGIPKEDVENFKGLQDIFSDFSFSNINSVQRGFDSINSTFDDGFKFLNDTIDEGNEIVKNGGVDIAGSLKSIADDISSQQFGGNNTGNLGKNLSDAFNKAKKGSKDAEKAVEKYKKELEKTSKTAEKVAKETQDFFLGVRKSILDASESIKKLNNDFEEFTKNETGDAVTKIANREVELAQEELSIRREISDLKTREGKVDEDAVKSQAKLEAQLSILKQKQAEQTNKTKKSAQESLALSIKNKEEQISALRNGENVTSETKDRLDLEKELNKIIRERSQIQQFGGEIGGAGGLDKAIEEARKRASESEFDRIKRESQERINAKEIEIKKEIDAQKKIIATQQRFLEIQAAGDRKAARDKRALAKIAKDQAILDQEEIQKRLEKLGFEELTREETFQLLKQALKATTLEDEKKKVTQQQQELLDVRNEFNLKNEENFKASVDRMIAENNRLISSIKQAQVEQIRLNSLRSKRGGRGGGGGGGSTFNIPVTVNNSVDGQSLANRIKQLNQ